MTANLATPLILNDDVLITPVGELAEDARAKLDCEPTDFAVTRVQARAGSKLVDASFAELLKRFRQQRTIVEAVILFAREKQLDPEKVLEGAFPMLKRMRDADFLVEPGKQRHESLHTGSIPPGTEVLGATIVRMIHELEDTELYLLVRPDNEYRVLKIERTTLGDRVGNEIRARLRHEAELLNGLGATRAPGLLGTGEWQGRYYLEMEFVPGVDAASAAAEGRESGRTDGRLLLAALARSIADAYADLHDHGIVHGDVHPGNVLVKADGTVVLIDFGLARATTADAMALPARGGVPFYYEPELAAAMLAGRAADPITERGEQHAIAALIYFLLTGGYWQNFRLGRQAMLEDLARLPPLSFTQRGVASWPEMEVVLGRALAKDPANRFPSTAAFASALRAVRKPEPVNGRSFPVSLGSQLESTLKLAAVDGPWFQSVFAPGPVASINYGSAGIALGLLHIALAREDTSLLMLADIWSQRAARECGRDDAFYNADLEIVPEVVGQSSPYHSLTGLHAVEALLGAALADPHRILGSAQAFVQAAQANAAGLDLTLGRSGLLNTAAILRDVLMARPEVDGTFLREFGNRVMEELWQAIDTKPEIKVADLEYLGIAHGWAGLLYATLHWCAVSGAVVPASMERRLDELAKLALPTGRGFDWPWTLRSHGEPSTMPGWCNGACGYVFLWTLAHATFGDARYHELAEKAAWRSWEAPDQIITLCCGHAGRAYALLNFYRHSREHIWLDRARSLAIRALHSGQQPPEFPHSLYKGSFGLTVLLAALEAPAEAAMPMFERFGYTENIRKDQ